MIESIQIENFQAHKTLRIDLDRVTTLVGPTDAGKSSVARFLRWVLLNESAGDITTWGASATHGTLMVDGQRVEREKNKRENFYRLENGPSYMAVGKSVPPDVSSLLNVSDVNFQNQLDAHFWLSETPGEVSRQLNQVVELSAMDDLATAAASEVSRLSATVRAKQEALDAAKAKRNELKWVSSACDEFGDVERADAGAVQIRARIENLDKAVQKATDTRDAALVAVNVASVGRDRLRDAETWAGAVSGRDILDNEVTQLEIAIRRIEVIQSIIGYSMTKAEVMKRRATDAGAWMDATDAWKKKADECLRLNNLITTVNKLEVNAINYRRDAEQARESLRVLMGDVCPLCGAEMGGDKCRV